jgi:hypothetical protein
MMAPALAIARHLGRSGTGPNEHHHSDLARITQETLGIAPKDVFWQNLLFQELLPNQPYGRCALYHCGGGAV